MGGGFAKLRTALCFAAAKPFGQALRPEPAGRCAAIPASRPPPMAAPRQGVAPPDPREGEALPATAWTASSGPPPFMPIRKKGGGAVGRERGTSSAQRSRRRPSRVHALPVPYASPTAFPAAVARLQAHDAGRDVPPHYCGPLRALISRYSRPQGAPSGRTGRDPDAAGIAWGAPRRSSAWGYARPKAAQATEAKRRMAEVRGAFAPPWGANLPLHIFA